MVYGLILEEGMEYYTDMKLVFDAIGNAQLDYNWLITNADVVCPQYFEGEEYFLADYRWLSGKELTEMIDSGNYYQWIWGVFSGFKKSVPKDEVLEYPLPFADCNRALWQYPPKIQHRLADIEIVSFDSSFMLILATDKKIIDRFKEYYPMSEDLAEYNRQFQEEYGDISHK